MSDTTEADAPDLSRTVFSTRLIDAPREKVFAAYVERDKIQRWWGPKGFTNDFQVFEPKLGGEWRFVMIGPDGKEYKNHSVIVELVPNEKFVYHHRSGPIYVGTVTFADEAGKTRLNFRMDFEPADFIAKMRDFILNANEENFDRLEAVLGIRNEPGA
jgi:uncharacterized protein YndB with AHSA1/START domain